MTSSWRHRLDHAHRALRSLACGVLLLFPGVASAASLTLAWDAAPSSAVRGYVVSYGASAGAYSATVDVGNVTTSTLASLTEGATYHFAVQAYDAGGIRSPYSNDIVATVPQTTPVAAFSASTTSGPAPLALNFINSSTGIITSYNWSFGDGTTSTVQSPAKSYSAAGTYTVSLTVTGPGGSSTRTNPGYITVTSSSDTVAPSVPTALVATAAGTTQISLAWNPSTDNVAVTGYQVERCQGATCGSFARIATATSNAYGDAGLAAGTTYRYRVRAVDAAGNVSAYSAIAGATTATATQAPVASFTSDVTSGTAPLTVAFSSTSTGSITSYAWSFGDGTTSAEQNPSKTYSAAGVYTVSLTVTGAGGSNTVTKSGYVAVGTPGAGGSLAGSVVSRAADANLTGVGAVDWAAWQANARKAGGSGAIGTYTVVGPGTANGYTADRRKLSWSDGTPTASGATTEGVEVAAGAGTGFRITVPADTTVRTLTLYAGGVGSSGRFAATLSDGSAAAFRSASVGGKSGSYSATLTLTYRAASAGQTLTVTWLADGAAAAFSTSSRASRPSTSTVRLQGAALR